MALEDLDLLFSYSCAIMYLLLASLMFRDQRDLPATRLFLPFALSQVIQLYAFTPVGDATPTPVAKLMVLFAAQTPPILCLFTLALFEDDFQMRKREWAFIGTWVLLSIADVFLVGTGFLGRFVDSAQQLFLVSAGFVVAWRLYQGFKSDLVEDRRRLRLIFAAGIVSIFISSVTTDLLLGRDWGPVWYEVVINSLMFVLVFGSFFWILRVDRGALSFEPAAAPVQNQTTPIEPDLSPTERLLKKKLDEAMADQAFLDPELSIGGLAQMIGAPEHQVRALINRALGHRNFRAFLNEQRLQTAQAALADPEKATVPILTIAMDSGFASLAPFNRAFKEATGETPSAWRAKALQVS